MNQDKMETKYIMKTIIIILALALLISGGYIIYQHTYSTVYEQGRIDGQFQTAQTISVTYQIPIIDNNTIQWIPLGNICGGVR